MVGMEPDANESCTVVYTTSVQVVSSVQLSYPVCLSMMKLNDTRNQWLTISPSFMWGVIFTACAVFPFFPCPTPFSIAWIQLMAYT
jgi:hypothetical protein